MLEHTANPVEEAKHTFLRLLEEGAGHKAIIALLVTLRSRMELNSEDAGWVLWNTCDRYAMLRQADKQYFYQSLFWDWCGAHFSSRLHWVVSDGTQAMTLSEGGYARAWSEWYDQANSRSQRTDENRGVRFESHRANAYAYTSFRQFRKAEMALDAIRDLLDEDIAWSNRDFAMAALHTLLLKLYTVSGEGAKIKDTQAALDDHLGACQDSCRLG